MITYLIYSKDSPMERDINHLAGELDRLHVDNKVVEADSMEGISLNDTYDLPQRPAVVVARDDGTMIERWMGELPSAENISYSYHQ